MFVFGKSISKYNSKRKANDLGHITLDLKADIFYPKEVPFFVKGMKFFFIYMK